jgi:hypothetical protein
MTTYGKRLKRNIARNRLLDRELDFLPSTISRDEVREIARTHGPQRRSSLPVRAALGMTDFLAKYSAPFLGMLIGAEYRAAKALYPLIGKEERFGDSLRFFLGESLSQRVDDANKVFKITGALVAATPDIILAALYGALIGIAGYCVLKWMLILGTFYRRKRKLARKISGLLE